MLTTSRLPRVGVLCSRRAPGLLAVLDSPARGRDFEVAVVVSSEPDCREADGLRQRGVRFVVHDIRAWYADRGARLTRDQVVREAYDRATLDLLRSAETDLVLLDGYVYLLTSVMLDGFPSRVLNLHFSDLTLRHDDGRPRYAGIRAVRDAVVDGRPETRATVHLVDREPDGGPMLVRSWAFPVSPMVAAARSWCATDMLKAYAYAHQEWMLQEVSGPVLSAALSLVTSGRVCLDALAAASSAASRPWLLDASGHLASPGQTDAAAPAVRLWRTAAGSGATCEGLMRRRRDRGSRTRTSKPGVFSMRERGRP